LSNPEFPGAWSLDDAMSLAGLEDEDVAQAALVGSGSWSGSVLVEEAAGPSSCAW